MRKEIFILKETYLILESIVIFVQLYSILDRSYFFFLIGKKKYIQKEPHENIRQTREYREGHKQRESTRKNNKTNRANKN